MNNLDPNSVEEGTLLKQNNKCYISTMHSNGDKKWALYNARQCDVNPVSYFCDQNNCLSVGDYLKHLTHVQQKVEKINARQTDEMNNKLSTINLYCKKHNIPLINVENALEIASYILPLKTTQLTYNKNTMITLMYAHIRHLI
tara:strand:+ start:1632 stop:2060 length:429 start_codon:yes stop_codon:yes gene_type:complete